jgi:hypothetical protein
MGELEEIWIKGYTVAERHCFYFCHGIVIAL